MEIDGYQPVMMIATQSGVVFVCEVEMPSREVRSQRNTHGLSYQVSTVERLTVN